MRSTIIAFAALAITGVSAVGHAVVKNNCQDKFTVWSVGAEISKPTTVAPGEKYTEKMRKDATTGGIAIKITKEDDGLWTEKAQQVFAYALEGDKVWYDLSTVHGDPFSGSALKVAAKGGKSIDWPQGTNPAGEFSQIKVTGSRSDVVFTACAE